METLSSEERACLHAVAQGRVRAEADCRPGVLVRLQRHGLVLRRPLRLMPLENMAHDFTLSPAGYVLLERLKHSE